MALQEIEVTLRRKPEDDDVPVKIRPCLLYDGHRYPLGAEFTIGSSPDADLRLDPRRAAERHAVVRTSAEGLDSL